MASFPLNNNPKYGYDLEIRYEPFFLEYNTHEAIVKLPRQFNTDHINEVAEQVFLCDPIGNLFHVHLNKLNGEVFIDQGWKEIGKSYGIWLGGWARMVYVRSDRFLITMRDRLDQEVVYPTPAKLFSLGDTPRLLYTFGGDPGTSQIATICQKPDLFHILEKTLTVADMYTGRLHIPYDFCEIAFRRSGIRIVLFDDFGIETSCYLQYRSGCPGFCGIADGWFAFSRLEELAPGMRVQLGVPATNPNLLSFKRLPN